MKYPNKRVLIITYYWPPAGGITVLRCLKIAKYLRQFGWEPVIYTAQNAHYPFIDKSNIKDIPSDIEIITQPIWEPYSIYKLFTRKKSDVNVNNVFYTDESAQGWAHKMSIWIRSNFFIPDARAKWIEPSLIRLTTYLADHPVDAILSDGPPHTNTRIATLLSKKTGLPWLADFQDPWTQVDYYQMLHLTSAGDKKHRAMEQEAFQQASKITIVSDTWKKDLEKIGANNVSVVPWGYDPDDYIAVPTTSIESSFMLTHTGIMGHDRNPKVLFQVINEMINQHVDLRVSFKIRLLGQVDHSVRDSIMDNNLVENVDYKGTVPRDEALSMTMTSPILLLLLNQQDNAKGRIPGKLFEYLAARRPILALGPIQSDVQKIIESTSAGYYCDYNDSQSIRAAVEDLYKKFKNGSIYNPVRSQIDHYSNYNTTKKIAELLNQII